MDIQTIFQFLTEGAPDRVFGIVVAFLLTLIIVGTTLFYIFESMFSALSSLFQSFKRKEKIIEVPKYSDINVEKLDKTIKEFTELLKERKNELLM
jgi:hypothetical protein